MITSTVAAKIILEMNKQYWYRGTLLFGYISTNDKAFTISFLDFYLFDSVTHAGKDTILQYSEVDFRKFLVDAAREMMIQIYGVLFNTLLFGDAPKQFTEWFKRWGDREGLYKSGVLVVGDREGGAGFDLKQLAEQLGMLVVK